MYRPAAAAREWPLLAVSVSRTQCQEADFRVVGHADRGQLSAEAGNSH